MFCLFDKENTVSISAPNADGAVLLAIRDLQRNLLALSRKSRGFELADKGGINIITENGEPESYTVKIDSNGVTICGGDVLGTVFGIYAFATKVLEIPPTYRLTDLFPKAKETLTPDDVFFTSPKREIKFRGWFLNDEDLLTEFKKSGGVRHIDYRFYNTVMDTEVLDMVLETALRLEINLIIPSSFVDIDNPDEEKLVEAVYNRGLYVTQHHVEPLGVSYFGASNYMKKHRLDGELSFITNRPVMEEIWRYYSKKWAKYSDRVVWQLGLRGRADEAVWKLDKSSPASNEGRGALISDAINTQYKIVKEILGGKSFYSTSTFWLEGARLYGQGHLTLPEDTIAIFSDVGLDQMFGDDFYSVKRLEGRKYGIYYHVAFYSRGPHLADTCNPLKMELSYKEAARSDSLYYSIVNVSNVRPLIYSVSANAELMADPHGFDYQSFKEKFHRKVFSDAWKTVAKLRDRFYIACGNMGEELLKKLCDAADFYYHDYGGLPFTRYTFDDGDLYMTGRQILKGIFTRYEDYAKLLSELEASTKRFERLYADMVSAESEIPADALGYYRTFLEYQTFYMAKSSRWCALCLQMNALEKSERTELGKEAVACLEAILSARKIEACGKWQGWHNGEKKFNLTECVRLTEEFSGYHKKM